VRQCPALAAAVPGRSVLAPPPSGIGHHLSVTASFR
jgi:hypothetical protein